jgi:hypothetical protein
LDSRILKFEKEQLILFVGKSRGKR